MPMSATLVGYFVHMAAINDVVYPKSGRVRWASHNTSPVICCAYRTLVSESSSASSGMACQLLGDRHLVLLLG